MRPALRAWLPLAPVLGFVYLLRSVSHRQLVIDWDETVYFYVARDWVSGGLPYVTAWDIKGPGMYAVFVPVIATYGFDIHALRVFTSLYHLATLVFVHGLALRDGVPGVAWLAPLVFGVMFASPDYLGLAANGELLLMLPACASLLLLHRARDRVGTRAGPWLVGAGALAGSAFLIKQTSVFTSLAPAFVWLVLGLRNAATRSRTLRGASGYAAGFAAVVVATAAYFVAAGGGREFAETILPIAGQRTQMLGFEDAWRRYLAYGLASLRYDPLTVCALAATAFVGIKGTRDPAAAARERSYEVLALLASTQLGILSLQFMFPHYFLQNALPFALAVTAALARLERPRARRVLAAALAVLCVVVALARDPRAVRAETWSARSEAPSDEEEVARWIRERTSPTDTIYVVGAEPVIYLLAERYSPTRHFFYVWLAPAFERAFGHTAEALADLERARPRYIVLGRIREDPDQYGIDELLRFIARHYEREATVAGHVLFRPRP